jgi:hypothetical protein
MSPIIQAFKETIMINVTIVILTIFFAIGSISPLLITDEMRDIVEIRN